MWLLRILMWTFGCRLLIHSIIVRLWSSGGQLEGVRVECVLRGRLGRGGVGRHAGAGTVHVTRSAGRGRGTRGRAPVGMWSRCKVVGVVCVWWGLWLGRGWVTAGLMRSCSPCCVLRWLGVGRSRGAPVAGLAVVHGDRGCSSGRGRRCSPATVGGCGGRGVAHSIAGRSTPLVHHRAIAHALGIVPRLRSLDLHLLVLNVDIVLGHSCVHCCIRLKTEKSKTTSLLLLLVIHDDYLCHTTISTKIVAKICLCYAGWQSTKEHFRPVDILLGFLHGSGVARLGVNSSSIKVVWTALDDTVYVERVAEGHKAKSSRPSCLCILHDDTVNDLSKPGEVAEQGVLIGLPGQPAHKQLAFLLVFMFY